jgi:iron(III) transport system permease protein
VFFQRYEGTRRFVAAAMKGAPPRRRPLTTGRRRALAILCGTAFSILLALPVFTLVVVSLAQESDWTTQALPPSYSLSNYAQLLKDPNVFEPFLNSISMAAIAAVAALIWSFCVARLVTRGQRRHPWQRVLSILVLVPWALPGTVVAIAVAEAYGRPTWLMGSYILVGTFWILPAIYFLRFMPLVVRAVQASMEQMDPTLEQAAETLGARWWQRFLRITFPLTLPGALAGSLMAFIIALGEYVASVLVFVPTNRPISIAIASELRDFRLGLAAAYGVLLIGIIALSMIAATKIERWRA